ncbi:MAG: glycosyltransferase family 39 protein, partial [Lachnospiraceae bacterium]|nr:glycosyltransferase family 39 protein [Lachnospiraceae bacterium]
MNANLKKFLYYFLPVLLIVISLVSIVNRCIWLDEVYSMKLVKHPFWELIQLDARDVHPPLYYIVLRCGFLSLGKFIDPLYVGKFVSLIPYIILVIIGFTHIKKVYGTKISFLFNILVMGMPKMLLYSTEIRMYSLGMLFVTCAFLQIHSIIDNEKANVKNYVLLALFSTLASYTHYFSCASAIVIYAEIFILWLIRKNVKEIGKLIASGILVVILYIPWLSVFFKQATKVSDDYWIGPVSLSSIKGDIGFLFRANNIALRIIICIIFVIGIVGIHKCEKKNRENALCGIGVWAGTLALGIILSIIIRPVFVSRYVMGAAACMWLGIAIGISQIDLKKYKRFELAVPAIVTVICMLNSTDYLCREMREKRNLEVCLSEIDQYTGKDRIILSDYLHLNGVFSYYHPEANNVLYEESLSELAKDIYSDCRLTQIEDLSEVHNYP